MADIKQIKTPDGTIYDLRVEAATNSVSGSVKLNPAEHIELNSDGQLKVGGRLGQFSSQEVPEGGLYYPTSITPEKVAKNSFLISEATGLTVNSSRVFALFAGAGVTLKTSAAANATTFQVSNTFANRFSCACARGGYATIEEATAGTNIVKVTGVYCANTPNTPLVPYSGATENNNNIVITTDAPLSTTDSITKLRLYGSMTFDSSVHIGQGVGTGGVSGKGKLLQLGQSQLALDGNSIMVGNSLFTSKNRVALFGANHINFVQGACLTGEGHDTTNGTFIGVTAHGKYSDVKADTAFALGNGTSNTVRSNLFEVKSDGRVLSNGANPAYPVGSYYWTSDSSFDPNVSFGGTWELMDEGITLVSAGTNYTIQSGTTKDGGDASVTLDTTQIPAHTHGNKSLSGTFGLRKTGNGYATVLTTSGIASVATTGSGNGAQNGSTVANQALDTVTINASHEHTSVGGGGAHNNMPPYKAAYCWHRTA